MMAAFELTKHSTILSADIASTKHDKHIWLGSAPVFESSRQNM
jgi:hypothetical protein